MSARPVHPAVAEWAESMVGYRMSLGADQAGGGDKRQGLVVDWKADTTGHGVFFVLDRGPGRADKDRYREKYRHLPERVREAAGAPRPSRRNAR